MLCNITHLFKSNLVLHVLRSSYRIKYKLILISAICASTFGIIAGPYSAIDNLFKVVENSQKKENLADLELITSPEDIRNLPSFYLNKLDHVDNRLLLRGNLLIDRKLVSALFIGQDSFLTQKVNRLKVLDGNLPFEKDIQGVAIERNCAASFHKKIGDDLLLSINQSKHRLTIRSIVESPEYLTAPVNPNIYIPSNGSLCVIFGNKHLASEQFGFEAFNSLIFKFKKADTYLFTKVQEKASAKLSIDYFITSNDQYAQRFLSKNLGVFKVFIPVIVIIFLITTSTSIFFLMYQWINQERPTISILMTLGYQKFQILAAYTLPLTIVITFTFLLGYLFAWFDAWCFGSFYAKAVGIPSPSSNLEYNHLTTASSLTLLAIFIGIYSPFKSIFKISPLEALRETSPHDKPPQFIQKTALMIKGRFWLKYPVRNLLRHWKVTSLSLISMALTLATTICFNITNTSMQQTAYSSFSKDKWQAVIDLDTPFWKEDLGNFEKSIKKSHWSPFIKGGVQIIHGNKTNNAFLIGVERDQNVRNPKLLEGKGLDNTRNGIIIERSLASASNIKSGDLVQLKVHNQSFEAEVLGIHTSGISGEVVTSRNFAEKVLGLEDQFTGVFLISPKLNQEELLKINQIPGVIGVITKDKIYSAILELSNNIHVIINISIGISIFIAMLFISSSNSFTLDAKSQDYRVLLAIGYSRKFIIQSALIETIVTLAIASILAIPISMFFSYLLNDRLTEIWFKVTTITSKKDFLTVILPTFVMLPSVVWFLTSKSVGKASAKLSNHRKSL